MFYEGYDRQFVQPSIKPWIDPVSEAAQNAERIIHAGRQSGKTALLYETVAKRLGLNYNELVREFGKETELLERARLGRNQNTADGEAQDRGTREPDGAGRMGEGVPTPGSLGAGRAHPGRDLHWTRGLRRRRHHWQSHDQGLWSVSHQSMGWGFLACGFLAPGVGAMWGTDAAFSAGTLAAAAWCLILAFANWTPPSGSGE
jgi:hypothetical protein